MANQDRKRNRNRNQQESKHLKTHICQYCGKSYTQETYLAKHMQKHSDRPDKRPPIGSAAAAAAAAAAAGANNNAAHGGGGGGGGATHHNSAASPTATSHSQAAAAAAAAAAADAAYWPKVDPAAYGGHDRLGDYGGMLAADPRLTAAAAHHADPRHQLESPHATLGGYDAAVKTSASAFSPIQNAAAAGAMLNSGGFSMAAAAGSRNYFYDPLTFPKHHSQVRQKEFFKMSFSRCAAVAFFRDGDFGGSGLLSHLSNGRFDATFHLPGRLRLQGRGRRVRRRRQLLPQPAHLPLPDPQLRPPAGGGGLGGGCRGLGRLHRPAALAEGEGGPVRWGH